LQNCIGAIDGTHVHVTISGEKAAPFRNRKGTLSQNVMVACDFDLNFTFISCGWEGLDTMEVSREEKAKALGVFKNAVNHELFICADMETALMWLRGEMA
jgi:hypothetical protein